MENGISQGGQHPTLHGLPNNSSKPHPNILLPKLYGLVNLVFAFYSAGLSWVIQLTLFDRQRESKPTGCNHGACSVSLPPTSKLASRFPFQALHLKLWELSTFQRAITLEQATRHLPQSQAPQAGCHPAFTCMFPSWASPAGVPCISLVPDT